MAQRYFEESAHAALYAKYRPIPPVGITETIFAFLNEKYNGPLTSCLDVGCGNGQCTGLFAPFFEEVIGTDISPGQLEYARQGNFPSNVKFLESPAEKMPCPENSVQLVNSGQACHWFDLPAFFKEADRVLCTNGVISLFGYGLPTFDPMKENSQLDKTLENLYHNELAGFWGSGCKILDNEYRDINLPYKETKRCDVWSDPFELTLQHLTVLIRTWSGYQTFTNSRGEDAGTKLLEKFTTDVQHILDTDAEPKDIPLKIRRKYFLLMARKN